MAKIDILVPVYNAQPYLRKCMDSILSQTFQDFQLILIDDGSTDKSGEICDEYAADNEKVKVAHQENQGVAAARNRGIKESTSQYVTFVDSDDYVDRRYLETLYQAVRKHHANLAVSCHIDISNGQRLTKACREEREENTRILSREDAYRYMLDDTPMLMAAWGKMYERNLLSSIQYPPGEIYEDIKVIDQIVEASDIIAYTSYRGYYHVQRGESVTGNLLLCHETLLENERYLKAFIDENYPDISKIARAHYLEHCFSLFNAMLTNPLYQQERKDLKREIIKEWKLLIFGKNSAPLKRMGTICLMLGIPWYRFVWKLFKTMDKRRGLSQSHGN